MFWSAAVLIFSILLDIFNLHGLSNFGVIGDSYEIQRH